MAFDLKKDWPIVAAGGAALVAVVVLRGGGGGTTTSATPSTADTTDSTDQGPNANQLALIEAAMGIDAQQQQYQDELQLAQISADTSEYNSYESNLDNEFNSIIGFNTSAVQSAAAVQALKAQQPSGISQWAGFLQSFANAVSSVTTGFQGGAKPSTSGAATPPPSNAVWA